MKKIIALVLAISILGVFAVGCSPKNDSGGNGDKLIVDLEEIHEAVKESLGEDYTPNVEMDLEQLESMLNIKESDMKSYIAESPMISTQVDTFIAIEAAEGKADDIEEALNTYRKYLIEDSLQYPMNIAKINASKVVRHGDYIFFLMLGKYDERQEITEEEALEFAKEEVNKIEDVIKNFFK